MELFCHLNNTGSGGRQSRVVPASALFFFLFFLKKCEAEVVRTHEWRPPALCRNTFQLTCTTSRCFTLLPLPPPPPLSCCMTVRRWTSDIRSGISARGRQMNLKREFFFYLRDNKLCEVASLGIKTLVLFSSFHLICGHLFINS